MWKDRRWYVTYGFQWDVRGWWFCWWTPAWHDGRGPYISIGFGFGAWYRGY